MVRSFSLAISLVVALAGLAVAENLVIEVVAIRNRPAADLVPPLQAVLGSEATVTAYENRLIVRAPRALLPQIRRLVDELDVQPRSLWITVHQDRDLAASGRSVEAGVAVGPGGVAAGGSISADRNAEQGDDVHRLRVLEGTAAFISFGESVPMETALVTPAPGGAVVVPGTTYQQAERGFWVVARLAGDRVTLEIETALDEARGAGVLESQGVSTTVSGCLGEWVSLGEIGLQSEARAAGILHAGRATRSEQRTVRVKVEAVP